MNPSTTLPPCEWVSILGSWIWWDIFVKEPVNDSLLSRLLTVRFSSCTVGDHTRPLFHSPIVFLSWRIRLAAAEEPSCFTESP